MLAVIRTGGKQYIVEPGQKIKIEKLPPKEGSEVVFEDVLLLEKDGNVQIGTPLVKGVKATGKVLQQGKEEKIVVFRFRSKKRYKKKKGHRQPFTEVQITSLEPS
ncbi:MAG: 50S ribosomal protein L21 [Patescibacteria group bacterium]